MIDTILTSPRLHLIRWVGYHSVASLARLRIAVSCAVFVGALLMQSCATQEMSTTENAAVPSSNAAEGQPAQQDDAADVADSAAGTITFEDIYRDRYKTTPDEPE
mgnify:CR=1 FL=1